MLSLFCTSCIVCAAASRCPPRCCEKAYILYLQVIYLLHRGSGAERLGGCVAVSAALLEETLPPLAAGEPAGPASGPDPAAGGAAGTPVLMTYGERDAALAPAVLASARVLRQAGARDRISGFGRCTKA